MQNSIAIIWVFFVLEPFCKLQSIWHFDVNWLISNQFSLRDLKSVAFLVMKYVDLITKYELLQNAMFITKFVGTQSNNTILLSLFQSMKHFEWKWRKVKQSSDRSIYLLASFQKSVV